MNSKIKIIILIAMLLLTGCAPKQDAIIISAAASLKDSLEVINEMYAKEFPDQHVVFNYGGSGMLRRQIEQGAPVDAFLSASTEHMRALEKQELVQGSDGNALISNGLVMVSHNEGLYQSVNEVIASEGRIAIATPETTPAGKYAKEALLAMGLWESIQSRLVYGKDVRHVLTLVEQQSVDTGFVYESDAVASSAVQVIEQIDRTLHTPIHYFVAVVSNREKQDQAKQFIDFLSLPKSQAVFTRYGFLPTDCSNGTMN